MSASLFPFITGLALVLLLGWCVNATARAYGAIYANVGARGTLLGTLGVFAGLAAFAFLIIITP